MTRYDACELDVPAALNKLPGFPFDLNVSFSGIPTSHVEKMQHMWPTVAFYRLTVNVAQ